MQTARTSSGCSTPHGTGCSQSTAPDWRHYLRVRRGQGFAGAQCVTTQRRAFVPEVAQKAAFLGSAPTKVNPCFFTDLDTRIALMVEEGMVPALVAVWCCTPSDPGRALGEEDVLALGRYIVSRYEAYPLVWFLGGDGDYRGEKAEMWKRIGRSVFTSGAARIATMHPCGRQWVADEFRSEPWYSFVGYQSGHAAPEVSAEWIHSPQVSVEHRREPPRPLIDLEPRYEHHIPYSMDRVFTTGEIPMVCTGVR